MASSNRDDYQTHTLLDFRAKLRSLHDINGILAKTESFDDFCRLAIDLGRERLGFDRLGLWFLSPDQRYVSGSFGTDEQGQIRDERDQQIELLPEHIADGMLEPGGRQIFLIDMPLLNDKGEVVGHGDLVRGNLWDGEQVLGWLNADNLIHREPWTDYQGELLGLYATLIGQLVTRKRIEKEIRTQEAEARQFQDRLKLLHEVTSELSQTGSFDDLCRRAVELGHSKLGFDRLGLWFLDADPAYMIGTFGIDESGQIRDERHQRLQVEPGEFVREILDGRVFAATRDDVPLYNDQHEIVGHGWKAVAQMWDRERNVGWISTDNFLSHKPLTNYELELLSLYADTLGHLATVRKAEEALVAERTMLRTIIDTVPDFIYVKDTESRFTLVNKACWEGTPGASAEEDMLGKTDRDILPDEYAERFTADDQRVMTWGVSITTVEEPGRPKNAQATTLLTTKVPLRDAHNRIIGLVGVSHDITELKRIQQQTLDLAVEKERVHVLRQSITNISHDLRTPLATIKSLLYVLEHMNDPAQQWDKLQGIKRQTTLLEQRIQELLYSARLENAADIDRTPVDLNAICTHVVQRFHPMIDERSLTITFDFAPDLPKVLGNENDLDRVVSNLLQNAIAYTPDEGTVQLRTFVQGGQVGLEVLDTGIGISKDNLPYIFDHFFRVDKSRSMDKGGMGLGLAIVKRIVEIHGGTVQVESVLGQGSTFRLLLPAAPSVQAKPAP